MLSSGRSLEQPLNTRTTRIITAKEDVILIMVVTNEEYDGVTKRMGYENMNDYTSCKVVMKFKLCALTERSVSQA